jgi:hypothetical protein
LAALGVVFGDIGTSPLYTLKTVLNLTGANPDAATTLGAIAQTRDTAVSTASTVWRRPARALRQAQVVFEEDWHVVGCCHLSGLRCSDRAAGPYGSSRTGTKS